jgi:chromate transporter
MQIKLADISRYFFKLGSLGFGGPAALVGYMQRDLVEREHWLTPDEFAQGVALSAALPGPLAAQVAMWIGFLRRGFWGCTVAAVSFIAPPFVLVVLVAIIYVHFQQEHWLRALFYGIGPATCALVFESCFRLGKKYLPDLKMKTLAAICLIVTVAARAELIVLFVIGGLLGIAIYAPPSWLKLKRGALLLFAPLPCVAIGPVSHKLLSIALLFFKAGAFTFGSGLAVAPFLHQNAVIDHAWITEQQFTDTVAVGMITPGPVVIMSTFAGYLMSGFWGAVIASICVFLPVYLAVIFAGPWLLKHYKHPRIAAFCKGATAAAVGVISGAGIIVARSVILDWLTALIGIVSLVLLVRWKVSGLWLVLGAGLFGFLFFNRTI